MSGDTEHKLRLINSWDLHSVVNCNCQAVFQSILTGYNHDNHGKSPIKKCTRGYDFWPSNAFEVGNHGTVGNQLFQLFANF